MSAATRIDTGSMRWKVAVHETAHLVVARHYRWRIRAVFIDDNGDGTTEGWWPWLRGRARRNTECAVIALAGHAANARLGFPPGADDEHIARDALRRADLTYDQAAAIARELVDRHWRRITTQARDLYRTGELR